MSFSERCGWVGCGRWPIRQGLYPITAKNFQIGRGAEGGRSVVLALRDHSLKTHRIPLLFLFFNERLCKSNTANMR